MAHEDKLHTRTLRWTGIIVIIAMLMVGYTLYSGHRFDSEFVIENSMNTINTIATMLIAGFLVIVRELFKSDNSITLENILQMKKEGLI